MPQSGVRSGLLLMVVGLFIVLRSTRRDASGRTLVDHILGKNAPPTLATGTPAPTITVPGTTAAAPTSLRTGANPRGTQILTGGQGSSPGSTGTAMAHQLIPTPAPYPTR